jgi:general secretion pathway protein H
MTGRPVTAAGGFTLLELLVVLVIVGIVLGLATLTLPRSDPADRLAEESRRVAVLVELARDEAILRGREMGLRLQDRQLEFMILDDTDWIMIENDTLRPRDLDEDVRAELLVEGAPAAGDPARRDIPQVWLASSGEMTPFTLVLTSRTRALGAWEVQGGAAGAIQLVSPEGS